VPIMLSIPKGPKSRDSERVLIKIEVASRTLGSDSDSVASDHVSAYLAVALGKVRDDNNEDDDGENVVTDFGR
jgi:hypothetical protein